MKKLDILTPIGILLGLIMVFIGILSNAGFEDSLQFIDIPSLAIVIGGISAAMLVNFNISEVKLTFSVVKESFRKKEQDIDMLIQTFVKLSEKARREGLLALEAEVENIDDEFIKKGILLAIDGIEAEMISDIMNAEIAAMEERHRQGRNLLERAGEYAPAWGMIGTLIGLVLMLKNLNDPASLGPKMAIAIITTFYGVLLANLFFLPMASKLENKSEQEVFLKQIVIEGVIGVQSGQNPRILEEKLSAFLSPESRGREKDDNDTGEMTNEA